MGKQKQKPSRSFTKAKVRKEKRKNLVTGPGWQLKLQILSSKDRNQRTVANGPNRIKLN